MILETQRLVLRELVQSDYPSLCKILQDDAVMYAYEGAFSDGEVQAWLDKQRASYRQYGHGLWAAVLKETGVMAGQCGLTWQDFNGVRVLEIGYLFQKDCWHQGYATEAAVACREYAFGQLGADEVYSIIRDTNLPSQNVARRNGMVIAGRLIKHYRGIDMPHRVYRVKKA